MPDPLREGLVRAKPADVGTERVSRGNHRGQDAKHTEYAQEVLGADGPGFDVPQGLAADPGALGSEGSGQAVELAPGAKVLAEDSLCTRDLERRTSRQRLTPSLTTAKVSTIDDNDNVSGY